MTTDSEMDGLSEIAPEMEKALEVLLEGGTQQQAADAADVTRETVNRWHRHHPGFIAEYNRRRQERSRNHADRMGAIDAKAMATVAEAIDGGDVEASLKWLKLNPPGARVADPPGPQTVEEVIEEETDTFASKLSKEFNQPYEDELLEAMGLIVPTRYLVRFGVIRRRREALGLPVEEDPILQPWWTEDCPPNTRMFICKTNETAVQVARGETQHDPWEVGTDVSPISPLDVWLLAEIIDPRHTNACTELKVGTDDLELAWVDAEFLRALRDLPEIRIARIAHKWTESPDISATIPVPEAIAIILALRKASDKGRRLYLLHHWDCGPDEDETDAPNPDEHDDPPTQERAA